MKILIACEFSGIVRDEFRKKGHDAFSCDLLPCDSDPRFHIQGDVFDIINEGWDMMIAHPPCTYLCQSGVTWLYKTPERWGHMRQGANFMRRLLEADIPKIAVENPIMHGHAKSIIGLKQTQVVQPWMFGHKEQKATCLWLKYLPPLNPTKNVREEMLKLPKNKRERINYLPPGPNRAKLRSVTFKGVARAMAQQWGGR